MFVPTREFALDNGPGATLMCKLVGSDVARARRCIKVLDDFRCVGDCAFPLALAIANFGLLGAIPQQCTWAIVASLYNVLHTLLR